MTTPQLFALATGQPIQPGPHRCFYCLASCDAAHRADELVKDSFTGRDTVGGGEYVCGGCVAAMAEKAMITIDGEQRSGQKVRGYSWIITRDGARACTKAHRELLLATCISPPEPPFVICIADSGQKHLLYRCPINISRESVRVCLEGDAIRFRPAELAARQRLCRQVCAAIGKPMLSETLTINDQVRVAEYFGDTIVLDEWLAVQRDPLSKLAAWLCPRKEDCTNAFPAVG